MAQSQQDVARAIDAGRLSDDPVQEPFVERCWKRDGSTNLMLLSAAVNNLLERQERPRGEKRMLRDEIKRVLVGGCVLTTPLAEFHIREIAYG